MNPNTPLYRNPPQAWVGFLGVALVLGFAGLAITGITASPAPVAAASPESATVSQARPEAPAMALYNGEGGAHDRLKPTPPGKNVPLRLLD